jgi:autotransporter-associated beta strand protein
VAVGDLNGDGRLDLAKGRPLGVLLGNGNGTFQDVQPIFGVRATSVALADVTGDGRPDLLVANYGSTPYSPGYGPGSLAVFLGNGDGTFQPAQGLVAGSHPAFITAADVNGDGLLDLVAVNKGSGNVSVLLGNRTQSTHFLITTPTTVTAGTPFTVTVTAKTPSNKPDFLYAGTVTLSSTDSQFLPPSPLTFTPNDMGQHTFTVTLKTTGAQTITASDNFILGTSNFFSVRAAPPDHLAFKQQPIGSIVGAPLNPAPVVELLDPFNNLTLTTASVSLTIAPTIPPAPGTFTTGSQTTVSAVNGVATFNNVAFTAAGSYTLNVSSAGLTGTTSNPFQISVPTTRTWSGLGPDNKWSDSANWLENLAPTAGDDLFFPDGAMRIASGTNDFSVAGGFSVHSINFIHQNNFTGMVGGYDLLGSSITLTAGINSDPSAGSTMGINKIDLAAITLTASQTFQGANSTLVISSPIALNGSTLTLDGLPAPTGNDALTGVISGMAAASTQAIVKNGAGQWLISGANTFGPPALMAGLIITVNAGTLAVNNSNSLGAAANAVSVASGASLQVSGGINLGQSLTISGGGNNFSAGAINIQDTNGNDQFGNITLAADSTILSANIGINTMTLNGMIQNQAHNLSIVGAGAYTTVLGSGATISGTGHVFNFGSIFSGTGSLSSPLNINQGTLAPGVSGAAAILHTADVTFGIGTTFQAVLTGSNPGPGGYTQLIADTGSISLAGANLNAALTFAPSAGQTFTIMQATQGTISGAFNGLPDGALVKFQVGAQTFSYAIHYFLNQVVLSSNPSLLITAPASVTAGNGFSLTVTALDAGNQNSSFTGTVHFTSTDPQVPSPLPDYTFKPTDMGRAVFSGVILKTAGGGTQTISVTSGTIGGSAVIPIVPAAASQLVFSQQPGGSIIGTTLNPAVVVQLLDPFGNLSTSTASITMTIASGPGGGGFSAGSTTTVSAVSGVATFSNLAFNTAGTYTITAASTTLTPATSNSFPISPVLTRTWTGKGPNNLWSDAANWQENLAPTPNDDLFFPDGAANFTPFDDFTNGFMVNTLNLVGVKGGYDLLGNTAIALDAGITGNKGANAIDMAGITLAGNESFNAAASILAISSPINLQSFTLTLDGSNTKTGGDVLTGAISGIGSINKVGVGTWLVSGNNTYLGATTINAGTLAINNNNSLGGTATGTTVNAGGSLQISGNLTLAEPLTLSGNGNNSSPGAIDIQDTTGTDQLTGTISLNAASFILSANIGVNTMTLTGAIQNNGFDLSIVGAGGFTTVLASTATVNGTGRVLNFGSIFSGTGTLNSALDINQGTLSPGAGGNPGTMNASDVNFGIGTNFKPIFSGSGTSESNSELMSSGSVNLAGSNLDLSLLPGFVSDPSKSYVIIQAAGSINGTFNGLPDGAPLTVNGQNFFIRYITASADSLHPSTFVGRTVIFPHPAATTTTLVPSANPVSPGQTEVFTATVTSPASPVAVISSSLISGTVTFFDGANPIGSGPVIQGAAQFATPSLSTGPHSITATFSDPTGAFLASSSSAVTLTVGSGTSVGWQHVLSGNFAKDSKGNIIKGASIAGMTAGGDWWVAVSNGSTFTNQMWGHWNTNVTWVDVQTGDFNGDGLTDIVGRNAQTGEWNVALSNGSTFTTSVWGSWSANPAVTWVDVKVADFDGNGKADITGRWLQAGTWYTALSNGTSFTTTAWATWSATVTWEDVKVGDFNGDKKADITGRYGAAGQWWTGISTGTSFTTSLWDTWAADSPNVTWADVQVGDFNGDGMADITGRWLQSGQWWTSISNGNGFSHTLWTTWNAKVTWVDVKVGDFTGDGKADITGRYLEGGQWWTGQSTGSAFISNLWDTWPAAAATWVDVQVGDFNGDGLPDIAGRSQQNGQWYVALSTSSLFSHSVWTTWAV